MPSLTRDMGTHWLYFVLFILPLASKTNRRIFDFGPCDWLLIGYVVLSVLLPPAAAELFVGQSVKSWGTEGRQEGDQQIPPLDHLHDRVNFRGEDIKDLHVHEVCKYIYNCI